MDAKNLAVLMRLKERITEDAEKLKTKSGVISTQALLSLMTDVNIALHGQPKDAKRPKKKKTSNSPGATKKMDIASKPSRTKPSAPWPVSEVFQGGIDQHTPGTASPTFGIKPVHAPSKTSKSAGGKFMFRGVSVSQAQYKSLKESLALLIYGNDHKFLKRKFDALSFYLAQARDDHEAVGVYEKIAKMLISGKTSKSESDVARKRRIALIKADVANVASSIKEAQKIADKDTPEWRKRYCRLCRAEFFIRRDWVKPPAMCKKCRDSFHDARTNKTSKNRKSGRTVYSHYVIYSGGSPGLGKRH